jgi:hypothetical protein
LTSLDRLLIFILIFASFHSKAQENEIQKDRNTFIVTGEIIDINGLPLVGADIIAEQINQETTSDFHGKFSLKVKEETNIEISFVDFEPIEIVVKPHTNIVIILKEKNSTKVTKKMTRKEMRRLRRDQRLNSKVKNDGSRFVEQVFYLLEVIAKNN